MWLLSEESVEALLAVGLLPALLEGALVELPEAVGADEVLWVELAHHGRDAAALDPAVARGASRLRPLRGLGNLWNTKVDNLS